MNPKMVCSYRFYLDLPVALVDCQIKECEFCLHHVCKGEYMAMHEIKLYGAEQKICCECVVDLQMGVKPEKVKMVQHRTVYRTDELEEDEEEVEGKLHLDGVDEVDIVPFVYPCGMVSVSSLGYFLSVCSSSNPSHPSLPLSLEAHHIQEYFKKKKRGRKRKFINSQQEKARHEEQMKRDKVVVQENLVVGYWELIPMESWDELLDPHDTATVRVSEERRAGKKKRNHWWFEANCPRLKEALVKSRYPSLRVH